jgi:myo-inositol-1(or 4)-monophosphatase
MIATETSAAVAPVQGAGDESFAGLEQTAVRLARMAGALILSSRETPGEVLFKGGSHAHHGSPASDVDRGVELMIRDEIKRVFPAHGIIGEELEDAPAGAGECVWVIDPLDGTSNFLNGLPFFASTIGVLRHGRPVAAATWCMSTPAGTPGVYHAHEGSALCFDRTTVARRPAPPWRGLASEPGRAPRYGSQWDTRVIGSAATECAFVAAGVLRVASMNRPRIWDIAGGVLLAQAAGCAVYIRTIDRWLPFDGFSTTRGSLREWRAGVLIGSQDDVGAIVAAPVD